MKDLTGMICGQLTVIGYDGYRNHHHYWRCRCSCGKETSVEQTHLLTGHTKSCGCYRRNRIQAMDLTGHVYGRLTVLNLTMQRDATNTGNAGVSAERLWYATVKT